MLQKLENIKNYKYPAISKPIFVVGMAITRRLSVGTFRYTISFILCHLVSDSGFNWKRWQQFLWIPAFVELHLLEQRADLQTHSICNILNYNCESLISYSLSGNGDLFCCLYVFHHTLYTLSIEDSFQTIKWRCPNVLPG